MIYTLGMILILAMPISTMLKHAKNIPLVHSYKINFRKPLKKHIRKTKNLKNSNDLYLHSDKMLNVLLDFYRNESLDILTQKQDSIKFLMNSTSIKSNLNNSLASLFISTLALIFSLMAVFNTKINSYDEGFVILGVSSLIFTLLMDALLEYILKSETISDLNNHLTAITYIVDLKDTHADKCSLLKLDLDNETLNKIRIINKKINM
ncbi:hypothetical protein [Paenibacillus polymyxa]|uniref:hypothetical protein n=1 Tax=Paenibacillus polymyxa TaxID=1406 RepID=UPI0025B68F5F|nr:hypothetical protein [Paenibacillus polymyxa]MDN4104782.1 hypothetical protein [Paenibacillus polymyxa]MDN4115181.1 hypothetical protein [Paenibacillus polymyxa]